MNRFDKRRERETRVPQKSYREREMLDQKKEKLELKCRTARNGTVMNDHELLEHIKRNTT